MTADEARERAAHYRQLAQEADDQIREALLMLAAEYEALAEKTSDPVGTGGAPQCGGPS